MVILIQIFTDFNPKYHKNILFIAPVAWILFYVIYYVEYQALIRSIWRFLAGKKIKWQKWNRVGISLNSIKRDSNFKINKIIRNRIIKLTNIHISKTARIVQE